MATITLEDGRTFPEHNGEALSWSVGLYMTWNEERAGYPKAKAVLAELDSGRIIALKRSRTRDQFDRMFGHNARKELDLIEAEIKSRC